MPPSVPSGRPARPRVALVTEDRYERLSPGHWYTDNILEEDRLLSEALVADGLEPERVSWSRPDLDWSRFDAAMLRTTWDYFERFAEFSAWLARVSAQTRLLNPFSLVRWNVDKHYLGDLGRRGVNTVPTIAIERGDLTPLTQILVEQRLHDAVIKPAVSGAARHTYRVSPSSAPDLEPIWRERLRQEAMLVQPFQRGIIEHGEVTLVVIDGRVTHGLRKVAKPGDFRVQDDHGGTVHPHDATAEEIAFAEQAMAACDPVPFYGRVDMVRDDHGRLAVMELELVEPELWFRLCPAAATRLSAAVARVVRGERPDRA